MRKKIIVMFATCILLAFVFAFSVSAETTVCETCSFNVTHETYRELYVCSVCGNATSLYNAKYITDIKSAIEAYLNTNPSSFEVNGPYEQMSDELKMAYSADSAGIGYALITSAEASFNAGGVFSCDGTNHRFERDGDYICSEGRVYGTLYRCTCGTSQIDNLTNEFWSDYRYAVNEFINSFDTSNEFPHGYHLSEYLMNNYPKIFNVIEAGGVSTDSITEIMAMPMDKLAQYFEQNFRCGDSHFFKPSGNSNEYYVEYCCSCGNFSYHFETTIADDVADAWNTFIESYVGTDEELQEKFDEYIQAKNPDLYSVMNSLDANFLNQLVGEISGAYLDGIASVDDNSAELESKYNEGYEQGKIDGVQEFMNSSTYNDILAEEYNEGVEAGEISGVNDFKKSTEYSQSLSEQYDKGVTEGVAEFKSSDNYKNALNERYSTGYTEGIAYYKTSTEYTKALDTQYDLGKSVAVSEYVTTDEYKAILSSEYDRGYDDGVSDTEIAEKENGSNVGTIFAIVGAVLFIGLGVSLFIPKKKRGRK